MFHQPSLLCLLTGLLGVLAMAPAAAFFLFRFIGTPVPTDAHALGEAPPVPSDMADDFAEASDDRSHPAG